MSFPVRLHGGVRIMNRPSPLNVSRLDRNAVPMFLEMQRRGMLLDQDRTAELDKRMRYEMEQVRQEVADATGGYDISSPDQVAALLFEKLKLPTDGIKWTASRKRLTVDDDALEHVSIHHAIPKRIQEYRKRAKIQSTYTTPLLRMAIEAHDGRIRTSLKLASVVSGRIASEDPNLMNIPVRVIAIDLVTGQKIKLGVEVRKCFVPSPGRVLVSVDESQIEMRVAAHEAADDNMIRVFSEGLDLHTATASYMYRCAYDAVTPEQRTNAKSAGFGILYGISAIGLLANFISAGATGWTEEKCQELIDKWFVAYPKIKAWLKLQLSRVRQFGFNWDLWGRIRYCPEAKSAHDKIVSEGDRNAGNTPIQAGAQGTMKLSMAIIWDLVLPKWWARGYDPWPLMQVHDELIWEVEEEIAEEFAQDCQEAIENCCRLRVPIKCGRAISKESWGHLK